MSDAMWWVVGPSGKPVEVKSQAHAERAVELTMRCMGMVYEIQRYVPGIGWVPASQCVEGRK